MKESAYRDLLIESIKKIPFETGGVLMGYWGNSGEVVVTGIIGPGPKAVHKNTSFEPDHKYHLQQISLQYLASDRTETYLGDWHTHPNAGAYLSWQDEKTLIRIAEFKQARLANPLMMILGTSPFGLKVWKHTFVKQFYTRRSNISACKLMFF